MLDTLYKYVEDQSVSRSLLDSIRHWFAVERRFAVLLSLSVAFHILFYAMLIALNSWAMQQIKPIRRQPVEFAVLTEIAPPPKHSTLRHAPESLNRADMDHLQYDPEQANDTDLLSRSPKPSSERGNKGLLPLTQTDLHQSMRARGSNPNSSFNQPSGQSGPPVISLTPTGQPPQAVTPTITSPPSIQPATSPPAPEQRPSGGGTVTGSQEPTQAGARRGDNNESSAYGIQRIEAQYIARVRAKVSKINEANLPHDWVATVLSDRVFVVFELTIRRGGRIQSLKLFTSSGYARLDALAREAIYIASPFEGYPQNADETITLTVNVYYTPSR